MTKFLGGAILVGTLCATHLHSATPTHFQLCAALLDDLTGPALPALSGQTLARLRTWAERRAAETSDVMTAFAAAMSSRNVLDAARQVPNVAASVRLLAHDEGLIEQARARHCTWAPDAAHSLNAH